jgi:hypothetical protein
MIANDDQLTQALEQLSGMYRSLASLRAEVMPKNRKWFALMAEGPVDEIRRLEEQVAEYTGRKAFETNDPDVWLRIVGPTLAWPEAPTSVLTAFLDAFRKGVQAVAEYLDTGHLTARPTRELKRACDLRIVTFQPGSLCVGMRVPDELQPSLFDDGDEPLARKALGQFLKVAEWVSSEEPATVLDRLAPDPHGQRLLLNSLKPFVPRPRGDVETVELSGRAVPRTGTITLTRSSHQRIDRAIDSLAAETVEEHVGDLRQIDLDKLSFILRNAEDVKEVPCVFEDDLLEAAKEGLDRRVRVTGARRMEAGRRTAPTLRVIRLEILEEEPSELAGEKSALH